MTIASAKAPSSAKSTCGAVVPGDGTAHEDARRRQLLTQQVEKPRVVPVGDLQEIGGLDRGAGVPRDPAFTNTRIPRRRARRSSGADTGVSSTPTVVLHAVPDAAPCGGEGEQVPFRTAAQEARDQVQHLHCGPRSRRRTMKRRATVSNSRRYVATSVERLVLRAPFRSTTVVDLRRRMGRLLKPHEPVGIRADRRDPHRMAPTSSNASRRTSKAPGVKPGTARPIRVAAPRSPRCLRVPPARRGR